MATEKLVEAVRACLELRQERRGRHKRDCVNSVKGGVILAIVMELNLIH